jgi:hypothetical protein
VHTDETKIIEGVLEMSKNNGIEKEIEIKGYTWFQVAEKIGIDYTTFYLWMKNKLTWEKEQIIRNALRF